jgi:hypothetical protein
MSLTPEEHHDAARTAVGLVRARLAQDDDQFRALTLGVDPWRLLVPLSDLAAQLVKVNVGEAWPTAMEQMSLLVAELNVGP